jgi:hypothetical protein
MTEHPVIASVHFADVGPGRALTVLRKTPPPRSIQGLRQANLAVAMPLRASGPPRPTLRRVGLIAFWDHDAALDAFLASGHRLAETFDDGWHARLRPVRAHGSWPGLPGDIPRTREMTSDEPSIVLTLGRLRLSQLGRFLRSSRAAEAAALVAPGFVWGTAMARPPFVATCSVWESSRAITTYAYADGDAAHPNAIAEQARKDFHKRSAFVRFRPYGVTGSLSGINPLSARALTT